MKMIKLTEPMWQIDVSRPVWVNAANIAYFHEWIFKQYSVSTPGQSTGDPVMTVTTSIIFTAMANEDQMAINVLETPGTIANLING